MQRHRYVEVQGVIVDNLNHEEQADHRYVCPDGIEQT